MKTIVPILMILQLVLFSCDTTNPHELMGSSVDSDKSFFNAMETNRQWPSYRGYYAAGYLDNANLPDSFNVETSHNIKWTLDVPGLGLSCPSIWDDNVFITTAVSDSDTEGYKTGLYGDIEPVNDSSEHIWKVYCIDKISGRVKWERDAFKGIPQVKRHPKSSHANTTVATDGKHVVVFFGSEGLYCYNVDGDLLWKRDFGLINSAWNLVESAQWEFCSSPVIFQDKVIIQADALNTAFVAVLNLFTGETVWRKEREEISTWCTPNIYFDGQEPRVVLNGYKHRGAYDMNSGEEIWNMSDGGDLPVPAPVVWKDLIYFNSAHGKHAPLIALKNSARGEIQYPDNDSVPGDDFAWFYDRGGAYMTSVLVYDSLLYRLRWNGNLACYDPRSGEVIYQQMVNPSSFIASPVASDGRLYMVSEEGELYIAQAGREYKLLHKIPLGEASLVTPGISEGTLILRTAGKLIAVGAP